jgi:hypothetical protein
VLAGAAWVRDLEAAYSFEYLLAAITSERTATSGIYKFDSEETTEYADIEHE